MLMKEWLRLRDQMRSKQDLTYLSQQNPQHSYDTLNAMFEQLFQRQVSRNFYLLRQHGRDFVRLFQSRRKTLIEIAHDYNLTPVMVARRVLELINVPIAIPVSTTSSSSTTTSTATPTTNTNPNNKRKITRFLREPTLIQDEYLRDQVSACVHTDDLFGPHVDRAHAVLGLEYESLLIQYVRSLRLEFETETDLRLRASFKTPDILLRVPIACHGRVVCWIDSKAKFADEYTLKKDYSDSVSSYVGRFGPGMVVYWFGFITDCVDCPMLQDEGVLVVDRFPEQTHLEMLPGSQLPLPTNANKQQQPFVISKGVGGDEILFGNNPQS